MRGAQTSQETVDVTGDRFVAETIGKVGAGQSGRMVQQHPHRDLPVLRRGHREVRHVAHHRGVQRDLPGVHQLHHRHRGDHLAHRTDPVHRRGRRLLSGLVHPTERLSPHRLATGHQSHRRRRRLGLPQRGPDRFATLFDRGGESRRRLFLGDLRSLDGRHTRDDGRRGHRRGQNPEDAHERPSCHAGPRCDAPTVRVRVGVVDHWTPWGCGATRDPPRSPIRDAQRRVRPRP